MKLFDVHAGQLIDCPDSSNIRYAILSHTWDAQLAPVSDFTFTSASTLAQPLRLKLDFACKLATARGIQYLWVDFLCINTSSSADVEESINGAFRRLSNCEVCFAYLDDLAPVGELFDDELFENQLFDKDTWSKCRYWTRAWTLQELIFAKKLEFYDSQWNHCSSKTSSALLPLLSDITGVPEAVLLDHRAISDISLGKRISWFATRCSRREEDIAYSLAAITGVRMSVRYGEGATSAFLRLQEEILHDSRDGSIFAWRSNCDQPVRGLLARSPSEFRHFAASHESHWQHPWAFDGIVQFSSKGIQIESQTNCDQSFIVLSIGKRQVDPTATENVGICLRNWNGIYVRVGAFAERIMPEIGDLQSIHTPRDLDSWTTTKVDFQIADSQSIDQEAINLISPLPFRLTSGMKSIVPSHSKYVTNFIPPTMELARIKRRWSGEPTISSHTTLSQSLPLYNYRFRTPIPPLPVDSSDESCSDSSDDSESECEDEEDEEDSLDGYSPSGDVDFQTIRPALVETLYGDLRAWMNSAQYAALANDQLPPRKRVRTSKKQPRSIRIEDEQDDTGFVVVSKYDGYFHLACPFYIRDPEKYQRCIASHDLQSMEDVIRHLRQSHQQPPYCPLCRRVFNGPMERDNHVRENLCTTPMLGEIEGLDHNQVVRLSKRDSTSVGETSRWMRVWKTVFPGIPKPHSPYLEQGAGLAMSMARDHWVAYGGEYISQDPACRDLIQTKEEYQIAAIKRSLLCDLLIRVMKEHGLRSQTGAG